MSAERLYIFCEGQTEETFANTTLYPHFLNRSSTYVIPIILPHKRRATSRLHKGGWTDYPRARSFIRNFMAEHHSDATWFTTLLDLYAIPENFPNLASAPKGDPFARIAALERSLANDIGTDSLWRFSAHLQLHEFEALLLAEPNEIKKSFPERGNAVDGLIAELADLPPELVNDGRNTAPSKRIIKYIPEYEGQKASVGPIIAARIGIAKLRQRCPHFHGWLSELETRTEADP
jgi:hypothetical protein